MDLKCLHLGILANASYNSTTGIHQLPNAIKRYGVGSSPKTKMSEHATKTESENSITKYTQLIERNDGSEVKIVATAFFGAGLHMSVGVDVFKREKANDQWILCKDKPDLRWREMSVDEYIKNGRSEMLQVASPGEILKVMDKIGKPMSPSFSQDSPSIGHDAEDSHQAMRPGMRA